MAPERTSKRSKGSGICEVCQKDIARDFSRHMAQHGPPQFVCSECGRGFHQRPGYDVHMHKWHTGLRPYACPHEWTDETRTIRKCPATFDDPAGLTRHRKKLHGYQPSARDRPVEARFRPSREIAKLAKHHEKTVVQKAAVRLARAMEAGAAAGAGPAGRSSHRPAPSAAAPTSLVSVAHPVPTVPARIGPQGAPSASSMYGAANAHYRPPSSPSGSHRASPAPTPYGANTTYHHPRPPSRADRYGYSHTPQPQSYVPGGIRYPSKSDVPPYDLPAATHSALGSWSLHDTAASFTAPFPNAGLSALGVPDVVAFDMPAREQLAGWDAYYYASPPSPSASSSRTGTASPPLRDHHRQHHASRYRC